MSFGISTSEILIRVSLIYFIKKKEIDHKLVHSFFNLQIFLMCPLNFFPRLLQYMKVYSKIQWKIWMWTSLFLI